ncbi:hypothetical protein [Paraburkholderia guartelaensis]|uniref:hypothetical protein n=1 Tax=Paraburkholderia guartelaensis TaxID=2546446 RepID=UPI002AB6BF9B|nr:hypothetical protein [Paraburkholderia guartelaensis]
MALGRKTGGREKGTPNHSTAEIRSLATVHAAEAIERLADLMRNAENETTRLAAIRELLDRGYGRPALHADIKSHVDTPPRDYREMTDEELEAIIYEARAEREHERANASGKAWRSDH